MDWPADVRPADLRQPDGFSCGAAVVVVARMLLDPAYRPDDLDDLDGVEQEVLATHRRLTSTRSMRDRFQVPWPRRLGTPPWAVANALTALTRERVVTVHARPRPAIGYDVLVEQVHSRPVAVYVGNRWLPRHVVLALAATGDGEAVRVFDPARGRLLTVPRASWHHRLDIAGWTHFWAVV